MFHRIDEFLASYREMAEGTVRIFEALTDGNIYQSVTGGHRTLGQIGWHIVCTVPEMMNRVDLGLGSVDPDAPPPRSATGIRSAYVKVSAELEAAVSGQWDDDTLQVSDRMYGEEWRRGRTLAVLIRHEVHHRGQMTVLLRQAGQKVPGVCGPAKEEWADHGLQAPAY